MQVLVLLLAVAIDLLFGEPREKSFAERFHPVVWIGGVISFLDCRVKRGRPRREQVLGLGILIFIILLFTMPIFFLSLFLYRYSLLFYIIISGIILKTTFSIRGLKDFALQTIRTNDIYEKRVRVAKLVSRNVGALGPEHLNSATIESVAENSADSIVAPFFFFTLFGVPGAVFYRVVNTADSMLGYKNRKYLYVGSSSAKLDRILNYIPERLAAMLIFVCSGKKFLAQSLSEHRKTKVPKTINAIAYGLGVTLEKIGYYIVKGGTKMPKDEHVRKSIKIMLKCAFCSLGILIAIILILYFTVYWLYGGNF